MTIYSHHASQEQFDPNELLELVWHAEAASFSSEDTARWMGCWAKGLLTTAADIDKVQRIIAAFREGSGANQPVHVKLNISWAHSDAEAVQQAYDRWRFNGAPDSAEVRQPEDFGPATRHLTYDNIRQQVFVSADLRAHMAHLRACTALGVESPQLPQPGAEPARVAGRSRRRGVTHATSRGPALSPIGVAAAWPGCGALLRTADKT